MIEIKNHSTRLPGDIFIAKDHPLAQWPAHKNIDYRMWLNECLEKKDKGVTAALNDLYIKNRNGKIGIYNEYMKSENGYLCEVARLIDTKVSDFLSTAQKAGDHTLDTTVTFFEGDKLSRRFEHILCRNTLIPHDGWLIDDVFLRNIHRGKGDMKKVMLKLRKAGCIMEIKVNAVLSSEYFITREERERLCQISKRLSL